MSRNYDNSLRDGIIKILKTLIIKEQNYEKFSTKQL